MSIFALLAFVFGITFIVMGIPFIGIGWASYSSDLNIVATHTYAVCNATGYRIRDVSCGNEIFCEEATARCSTYAIEVTYPIQNGQIALNTLTPSYACSAREADIDASRRIAYINNGTLVRSGRNTKPYPANQCYYKNDDPSILFFGNMPDPDASRGLGIAGLVISGVGVLLVIPGAIFTFCCSNSCGCGCGRRRRRW